MTFRPTLEEGRAINKIFVVRSLDMIEITLLKYFEYLFLSSRSRRFYSKDWVTDFERHRRDAFSGAKLKLAGIYHSQL